MCWLAATRGCIQGSWSGWDHLPRRQGQAAGFSKITSLKPLTGCARACLLGADRGAWHCLLSLPCATAPSCPWPAPQTTQTFRKRWVIFFLKKLRCDWHNIKLTTFNRTLQERLVLS